MSGDLSIDIERLSEEAIRGLMSEAGSYFPALWKSVEFDSYCKKLHASANFLIVKVKGNIIGFLAFYINSLNKQLYVTLVWVKDTFQNQGLGTKMFSFLENTYKKDFDTIALEVHIRNEKACAFYQKTGFVMAEMRVDKIFMQKFI